MIIRVERGWGGDGTNIWVMDYKGNQGFIAKPIQLDFQKVEAGCLLPEPTLFVPRDSQDEFFQAVSLALAGFQLFDDKEKYEHSAQIKKAMQDHIDSLKMVVDRVVK